MTKEKSTQSRDQRRQDRKDALALGATGLGLGLFIMQPGITAALHEIGPDFEGSKQVKLTNDPKEDTLTEVAVNNVDGAENHVKATVDKIVKMNPEVFQEGKAFIGSEDLGKKIDVPEEVR